MLGLDRLKSNSAVKALLQKGLLRNEEGLEEVRGLLDVLGLPHDPAPIVIHVTGTKGKGSVAAFLESLLRRAAGLKTGLFTSPHLISPTERIRVCGRAIDSETLNSHLQDERVDWSRINYFKGTLLAAWRSFLESSVDAAVIEVGIGGRYDSTNVLRHPAACVITSIGLDHQDMLGDTLASIAWHKAGIVKAGCPVFTVPQDPTVMQVIKEECLRCGSELVIVGDSTEFLGLGWPAAQNAALAAAVFSHLHPEADLHTAILETQWPGRQQIMDGRWFLDGAHTLESILTAKAWFSRTSSARKHLMFHCSHDRDYKRLLTPLLDIQWESAHFINVSTCPSDATHHQMADWFSAMQSIPCRVAKAAPMHLEGSILVTGSLYLVGHVMEQLRINLDRL